MSSKHIPVDGLRNAFGRSLLLSNTPLFQLDIPQVALKQNL